jgi:hypothetical protein
LTLQYHIFTKQPLYSVPTALNANLKKILSNNRASASKNVKNRPRDTMSLDVIAIGGRCAQIPGH